MESLMHLRQLNYKGRRAIQIHTLFFHFCKAISYDTSLLLDLLVSDETLFLLFFTKYLKFLIADWDLEDSIKYSAEFSNIHSVGSSHAIHAKPKRVAPGKSQGSPSEYSYYYELDYGTSRTIALHGSDTDPSFSSSWLSYHPCGPSHGWYDKHAHILSNEADLQNMMYMFARLMLSLQKMHDSGMIVFNVSPLVRLLHRVQTMSPHLFQGHVKLKM